MQLPGFRVVPVWFRVFQDGSPVVGTFSGVHCCDTVLSPLLLGNTNWIQLGFFFFGYVAKFDLYILFTMHYMIVTNCCFKQNTLKMTCAWSGMLRLT